MTAILLLVLALSATATTLLVKAEDPGVGKYLRIEFIGEGSVIATKEKTDETWTFESPADEWKVGAGTVLLEAFPAAGYVFVEWTGALESVKNPEYFRTEKYAIVTAVFDVAHTITASAGPNGTITPAGDVIVRHGYNQTFTFVPDEGYHVSAIIVNGTHQSVYAASYTFLGVTTDQTIHVDFSEDGTVNVPAGSGGNFFVDPLASLTIGSVTTGGVILGSSVIDLVLPGTAVILYFINWETVEGPTIEGGVVITFLVPEGIDPYTLTIVHGPSIAAINCDVSLDFQVDGTDVSIVANAIKFKIYDPRLDINMDGKLDQLDIHEINENKGTTLEDVTGSVVGEPPGPYFITTRPLADNPFFKAH